MILAAGPLMAAPLSWAIIPAVGRPTLLVDGRKLSNAARDELSRYAEIVEPAYLERSLELAAANGAVIRLDQATAPALLATKIEAAGGKFFFDLGDERSGNFERKFKDPDGVIFDISKHGWQGTDGYNKK